MNRSPFQSDLDAINKALQPIQYDDHTTSRRIEVAMMVLLVIVLPIIFLGVFG